MKKLILLVIMFITSSLSCYADSSSGELWKNLSTVIRQNCPNAQIQLPTSNSSNFFSAKNDTLIFNIHIKKVDGEFLEETLPTEGPNSRGFYLTIEVRNGKFSDYSKTTMPQESEGPYYRTYMNTPPIKDKNSYYSIRFEYGKNIDSKLKEAIFNALPK